MRTVIAVDAHRMGNDMARAFGGLFKLSYWIFLWPLLAMVVYPIALVVAGYGLIAALVFAVLGRPNTARSIARNSLHQAAVPCRWLRRLGQFR
jgi:hypothetical protein